jgi:hypothetical protein
MIKTEAQSTLVIRSKPDSADVYINGKLYGKTPLEILNVKEGYQSIKLKNDSLKSWWTTLYNVEKDSSNQIYAVLDGDYGLLTLYTNPSGANVYLNDSLIGETPLNECKVKTGTYNIKIKKENYILWEKFIEIAHTMKKMNITLSSLFGSLSFNNISANQNLYLDGKLLNSNNLENYKLPIGNHEIQLVDTRLNKRISDDIDVNTGNHYDVYFNYDEFSFKPLLYSSVVPGLGQIYAKSYLKGGLILLSTIASGYLTVLATNNYNRKMNEYNSFQEKYLAAVTEEDASYYRSMTQNAYDKVNTASTFKNIAIGTLVGIYLYNLFDAVLFSGKLDVMHFYEKANPYEIKNKIGFNSVKMEIQWKF